MFNVLLQPGSSVSLLGALMVLVLIYLVSTFGSQQDKDPPGPKPLPLLGNLLQVDLKRPYYSLLKVRKLFPCRRLSSTFLSDCESCINHDIAPLLLAFQEIRISVHRLLWIQESCGSGRIQDGEGGACQLCRWVWRQRHIFNRTGYEWRTRWVKINHFLFYIFCLPAVSYFISGVLWSNGDSWKEMRRFALTNLRDFGMGKRTSESKIIEECDYLIDVFKKFKGKYIRFNDLHFEQQLKRKIFFLLQEKLLIRPNRWTMQSLILSAPWSTAAGLNTMTQSLRLWSIEQTEIFNSRDLHQYKYNLLCLHGFQHSHFNTCDTKTFVNGKKKKNLKTFWFFFRQIYNLFPWFGKFLSKRKEFNKIYEANKKQNLQLFTHLKNTLNPQMCRGFVDAFVVRKQNLEVCKRLIEIYYLLKVATLVMANV